MSLVILTGENAANLYAFKFGVVKSLSVEDVEFPMAAFMDKADCDQYVAWKEAQAAAPDATP